MYSAIYFCPILTKSGVSRNIFVVEVPNTKSTKIRPAATVLIRTDVHGQPDKKLISALLYFRESLRGIKILTVTDYFISPIYRKQ